MSPQHIAFERKMKKGMDDMKKINSEPLKIAKVIYGSKELMECMESVIRIHQAV